MKPESFSQPLEVDRFVFASRTILIPGRKVSISFSVRKKSSFPIVQELILRLVNILGSASLELLVGFFDFSEKELSGAIRPLVEMGYFVEVNGEYELTNVGKRLFTFSEDGKPAFSEIEALEKSFIVEDHCGLPVFSQDIGSHLRVGKLEFISELPVPDSEREPVRLRIRRSFSEDFSHFLDKDKDLEKIRSEKLVLHKTDDVKTKDSLLIRVDVDCYFTVKRFLAEAYVVPLDDRLRGLSSRRELRSKIIKRASVEGVLDPDNSEVRFFREFFGPDFLDGCAELGAVVWPRLVPKLLNQQSYTLTSGDEFVAGDIFLPRNLVKIQDLLHRTLKAGDFSKANPLRVVWVRPFAESWGRSIRFLEAIEVLKRSLREVSEGGGLIDLYEHYDRFKVKGFPRLKSYERWFDNLKRFAAPTIPPKTEILLIGDAGGIALTHAYTPPRACVPCPLGVYFENNVRIQNIMRTEVAKHLRALPSNK